MSVSEILIPDDRKWEVSEDDDALTASGLMTNEDKGRLVVMEHGELVGLITRNGIAKYVQLMKR